MEKRKRSAADYGIAGAGGLAGGVAAYKGIPFLVDFIDTERQVRKDYPKITKAYIAQNPPEKVERMRKWIADGRKDLRQELKDYKVRPTNSQFFTSGPAQARYGLKMIRNADKPTPTMRRTAYIPRDNVTLDDVNKIRKVGQRVLLSGLGKMAAIPTAVVGGAAVADLINRKYKNRSSK